MRKIVFAAAIMFTFLFDFFPPAFAFSDDDDKFAQIGSFEAKYFNILIDSHKRINKIEKNVNCYTLIIETNGEHVIVSYIEMPNVKSEINSKGEILLSTIKKNRCGGSVSFFYKNEKFLKMAWNR